MKTNIKTYSELITFDSFEERFKYLSLNGIVGIDTFGFDRFMNQKFYRSTEWKRIRNEIILRDNGCDLGIEDRPIFGKVLIHHINPILPKDIIESTDFLMNPEYLVCVSHDTHNAIHYGDISYLKTKEVVNRIQNDTCPWRKV